MRRSKNDVSKYTRNYKSISQRRMTNPNNNHNDTDFDDEKEIERLRLLLRNSQQQLQNYESSSTILDNKDDRTQKKKKKEQLLSNKKRKRSSKEEDDDEEQEQGKDNDEEGQEQRTSILSLDLINENKRNVYTGRADDDENALVIVPSSTTKNKKNKKAKNTQQVVQLTTEELKHAKLQQKHMTRKLQQLEIRSAQKKKRQELYEQLQQHAQKIIPSNKKETNNANNNSSSSNRHSNSNSNSNGDAVDGTTMLMPLLSSSGNLSRKTKITKKKLLKKLIQKERAGIQLNKDELELLYPRQQRRQQTQNEEEKQYKEEQNRSFHNEEPPSQHATTTSTSSPQSMTGITMTHDNVEDEDRNCNEMKTIELEKDSVQQASKQSVSTKTGPPNTKRDDRNKEESMPSPKKYKAQPNKEEEKDSKQPRISITSTTTGSVDDSGGSSTVRSMNFVSQMMASISKLKQQTDEQRQKQQETEERGGGGGGKNDDANDGDEALSNAKQDMTTISNTYDIIPPPSKKTYIPSNPTILKTAGRLAEYEGHDLKRQQQQLRRRRMVVPITRPEIIEKTRYDLPVSTMEYEIVDTIRNNNVVLICAETGSGKSTQVCQFLYEAGFSKSPTDPDRTYLIGITQPRRVAAVSTAKRVCYEMGKGDGLSIKSTGGKKKGNVVAYKTRYETAGVGSDTNILFATDGILLQEIQDDLLLRRYSVIVLDETHERNLNTDVLIGLLSATITLRQKAAQEDPSLVPLRLVLMSATLRIEDFTQNKDLFSSSPPAVIKIPGRTYPVTIHHSKTTELDDYETAAFRKVCKIHRNLPQGGILVFLTGKQEITRMVNRLRDALNRNKASRSSQGRFTGTNDVVACDDENAPRELDDEELDGDDEAFDVSSDLEDTIIKSATLPTDVDDEAESVGPQDAYILPLYSMLSSEEQARVFAPVRENNRLIVVATNIAETSITIPGISYVVDTGRQKCRNYHAGTGVVSYDISWISKAAADQRAGRAGRTGPGHCYRLYSSSLYSRHMDAFALPEVLTRPLEDVMLSMKALKISNVSRFPFPTPPERGQMKAATKLLANIGCLDVSSVEEDGGDGAITKLGEAVAKLPLGVRYGKMLLVAAQAGVLDYAITVVSVMSEVSLFQRNEPRSTREATHEETRDGDESEGDANKEKQIRKEKKQAWRHRGGDVMAAMLAVGAYTYVGRGAGGASEQAVCRSFCEEHGLSFVVMSRIQRLRLHLARLAKNRLSCVESVASKTGGIVSSMKPPNRLQEDLLMQAIASGLLDNIAVLAPQGSIPGCHPFDLRSAYLSCSTSAKEPIFMDQNSVIYSRDFRQLPRWVCYDSVVRKIAKDGTPAIVMKKVTPVNASWIGALAKGTTLLTLDAPLLSPPPIYDKDKDAIMCSVVTKFGIHGWEIPPVRREMFEVVNSSKAKHRAETMVDDSFRWFARFLLEGLVIPGLKGLKDMLNDSPAIITRRSPLSKVAMLVSDLSEAGVDNAEALRKHWTQKDDKFLFRTIRYWIKREDHRRAKQLWITAVKIHVSGSLQA